jgi:hypothetical protein
VTAQRMESSPGCADSPKLGGKARFTLQPTGQTRREAECPCGKSFSSEVPDALADGS